MKFRVTMKTPDAMAQAIEQAVIAEIHTGDSQEDIYCKQVDAIHDVESLCEKWFTDGELLTVEIDTDAQTCVVVPVK